MPCTVSNTSRVLLYHLVHPPQAFSMGGAKLMPADFLINEDGIIIDTITAEDPSNPNLS